MMRRLTVGLLILTFGLLGCFSQIPRGASHSIVVDRMYFGRNIADTATVSDSAWAIFLSDEVTPKFPSGFTTWPAEGQWRGSDGVVVHERTFVLEIVRPVDASDPMSAIDRIIKEYKRRFRQESVLHVSTPGLAEF
jgi:hypothetical protein